MSRVQLPDGTIAAAGYPLPKYDIPGFGAVQLPVGTVLLEDGSQRCAHQRHSTKVQHVAVTIHIKETHFLM